MCDTMVALPPVTADGSVIFAKNSDRERNEAQATEFHPAAMHPPDAMLRVTRIAIPQVRRTRAVLISRPCWMWGAEMGANEHGVVIGNEAVQDRSSQLTPRQLEILDALSEGSSNKDIAATFGLAEKTVKAHVSAIFRALGVVNRTQAAAARRAKGAR